MSTPPPPHEYQSPPQEGQGYQSNYQGGYQGAPSGYPGGYPPPPPQAPSNTPLIVGVAVVLVLLVGALVFLLTRGNDDGASDYAASTPAPAASADLPAATEIPAAAAPAAPAPIQQPASAQPAAGGGSSTAPGSASRSVDLGGLRQYCETYERTSVARFQGLMVCYNIQMQQRSDGTFSGTGYKSWEVLAGTGGRDLEPSEQTPIRVTGSIDNNDTVRMQYSVQGERRTTTGTATFDGGHSVLYNTVGGESEDFPGTFRSSAANASGSARISATPLID